VPRADQCLTAKGRQLVNFDKLFLCCAHGSSKRCRQERLEDLPSYAVCIVLIEKVYRCAPLHPVKDSTTRDKTPIIWAEKHHSSSWFLYSGASLKAPANQLQSCLHQAIAHRKPLCKAFCDCRLCTAPATKLNAAQPVPEVIHTAGPGSLL
jgi:hypothetical protein